MCVQEIHIQSHTHAFPHPYMTSERTQKCRIRYSLLLLIAFRILKFFMMLALMVSNRTGAYEVVDLRKKIM